MTAVISEQHVERFRTLVAGRLGLALDESKQDILAEALRGRLDAVQGSADQYLSELSAKSYPSVELRRLAEALTVTETYFLRNAQQLRAFIETALPQRLSARAPSSMIRILSAGCASGDEPYSLAIALREELPSVADLVSITAVDINPAMLSKARRGIYTEYSLRDVPPAMRARWFHTDAKGFTLDPRIRDAVTFDERNLIQDDGVLWQPNAWDVVFCRNVIMYFDPLLARAVTTRIARSLVPGGFLFLGHAETLRGLSGDFHICHTHDTFYYRRKDALCEAPADDVTIHARAEQALQPLNDGAPWIEVVRSTTERIRALADSTADSTVTAAPPALAAEHTPSELQGVLTSLSSERFEGALAQLDSLPPEQASDPAALLMRAITQAHLGTLAAAEQTCQQLIASDEMSAGAHYVLALCREGRNDIRGAVEQDQVAVYLDPDFAMAQVHLGVLTRRQGEKASARRVLKQALVSLAREDAARLALFGGGFNREALLALCRAELIACGEPA
jgi:chemotaxis protein methyltransferase CheR